MDGHPALRGGQNPAYRPARHTPSSSAGWPRGLEQVADAAGDRVWTGCHLLHVDPGPSTWWNRRTADVDLDGECLARVHDDGLQGSMPWIDNAESGSANGFHSLEMTTA